MPFRSMWKAFFLMVVFLGAVSLAALFGFGPPADAATSGDTSITIVYPNGNEVWEIGSQQTIRWTYTGSPGSEVVIELRDGYSEPGYAGGTVYTVGKTSLGQDGVGSYTFTVPQNLRPACTYQVRISIPNTRYSDRSDDDFKILPPGGQPPITLLSPNGGEVWAPGSTQTISWRYTDELAGKTDSVDIYYFKTTNNYYNKLGSTPLGQNGTGSYTWEISTKSGPGKSPGSDYKIAVVAHNQRFIRDTSDSCFTVGYASPSQQEPPAQPPVEPQPPAEQQQPPVQPQPPQAAGQVLIDDPSFVTLTAVPNPFGQADIAYNLQVKANNPAYPVEVTYLLLNPNGTPQNPSTGIEVHPAGEFESTWGSASQYFYHTEVGGWAQPEYKANPQVFGLPHYRTAVMMLARYDKIYLVFLRENDGKLTSQVFKGGAFNGLDVPDLGKVTRAGNQFQIHSYGGPVEVGIWDKGEYRHDEVKGWAQESYAANDKLYDIPHYGMFMLMISRYDKLGLIVGNFNDGQLGTICFTGSRYLMRETVPGLCEVSSVGGLDLEGATGPIPRIEVKATAGKPVEVSHFAFDNTCWQWEVSGWAREEFKSNPQILPLKHYTPGFFMVSRYDQVGIFFYNENDLQMGVLPLSAGTLSGGPGTPAAPQQPQPPVQQPNASSPGGIKVLLNNQPLSFDQPPVIVNDRTMVPLRAIFQALGAEVNWDGATQTVTATRGDTVIILVIGSPTAFKDGETVTLSQPALLLGGRTMVPLRFVSEALGAEVNWDGATQTVTILH